jgi:hypothetical protein
MFEGHDEWLEPGNRGHVRIAVASPIRTASMNRTTEMSTLFCYHASPDRMLAWLRYCTSNTRGRASWLTVPGEVVRRFSWCGFECRFLRPTIAAVDQYCFPKLFTSRAYCYWTRWRGRYGGIAQESGLFHVKHGW